MVSNETTRILLFLAALLIIGSIFRLYNLNAVSFTHDESIQGVAVKSVLTQGSPVLGSGFLYVRALPYIYLQALSAKFLGWGEASLRLPSVLFNLGTIPLIYLFTRDLLGKKTALVAATALTFSTWEIEFSRVARMYTAFQFFYLLSLYTFYKGFIQERRVYQYAAFPIFLITFTIHELSFPLALSPLFLLIKYKPQKTNYSKILFSTATFCVIYFFYWYYIGKFFSSDHTHGTLAATNSLHETFFSSISIQFQKHLVLPHFSALDSILKYNTNLLWFFTGILAIITTTFFRFKSENMIFFYCFIYALIAISCFFHQIGLAIMILILFILIKKDNNPLSHPLFIISSFIILISFTFWLTYIMYYPEYQNFEHTSSSQLRKSLSMILEYPDIFDKHVKLLIEDWLGLSILTFSGVLLLFLTYLRMPTRKILYIMGVGYLFPLFAMSFFGSTREQPRYFFHLYTIMTAMSAYASVVVAETIIRPILRKFVIRSKQDNNHLLHVLVAIIITIVVSGEYDLLGPLKISQLPSIQTFKRYLRPLDRNRQKVFKADYRTCSQYVKSNLDEGDVVIALGNPVTRYVYTGHVDYFVMQGLDYFVIEGIESSVDVFTGSIHLSTLDALEKTLEKAKGTRVWILGAPCSSAKGAMPTDVCSYQQNLGPYTVCQGNAGAPPAYLLNRDERAL